MKLYNADCRDVIKKLNVNNAIIVTDPPFNIGYHYATYKDRLKEDEYLDFLSEVFSDLNCPFVVIHYPEMLYKLSARMNKTPEKVVSWVYNSNTAKQHRDICFFGIKPDFKKVVQPYKNPDDKRIKERIERGILGGRLYDWWQINQVKNVSKKGNCHPCVMPLQVMENIVGILPEEAVVIDPFMGSGTTGVACANKGRDFIGMEMDETYFHIAKQRIESAVLCEGVRNRLSVDVG